MNEEHEIGTAEKRSDFWMRIAALTFGMWSLMLPIGIAMVRSTVADVSAAQGQFVIEFKQYVLAMERRVTIIEERQGNVLRSLQQIEGRLSQQNNDSRSEREPKR